MAMAAAKGKNQVVLKEIMEFAEYLGMDPVEDGDLLWIAEQARNAPLPAPWSEHQGEDGNTYYYNSATDDSVWEHPLDEYYRNLYRKHKDEKSEQAARDAAYAKEAAMKEGQATDKLLAKKGRAEKRLKKKIRAATMVQKVWRGKMGRRKMNQEISLNAELMFWAASKLQAVFRSKVARRTAHEAKLEKLATKIQARFRGRRLRKMVIQNVSELVAAITVQRLWRGKQIRREFLAKRGKIQKQLDWEMENAAASRIQAIWRFKSEMRRKKQEDLLRKIFGGRAAGLSPEEDAAITIQRAAKKHWKWQPVISDAMKFKMFQNMQAQKFDNKKAKLEAQKNEITGQMMAHDVNQMANAAGKRREAKDMKAEMQERARLEAENAGPDPKATRAKARAEKRQKKLNARRELMVRMQTAAAVMVQRAFRRRMFRKRMRLLSRRTHVAAAKIQLAWRWHLSRIKKKEKHYIVKRLAILMDSLTHSLNEREKQVEQRDAATYIQTMWRGYMARELLSVMQAEHSAATAMQRAVRGWLLRMWLKRSRAAIRIQSAFRGFRARVRIARAKARDRARREREREIRDRRRRREERKKHELQLKKQVSCQQPVINLALCVCVFRAHNCSLACFDRILFIAVAGGERKQGGGGEAGKAGGGKEAARARGAEAAQRRQDPGNVQGLPDAQHCLPTIARAAPAECGGGSDPPEPTIRRRTHCASNGPRLARAAQLTAQARRDLRAKDLAGVLMPHRPVPPSILCARDPVLLSGALHTELSRSVS